jgi:outer membrane immunogenic protein
MKKLLLSGVASAMLFAGPALAADLPAKAPIYKAPPPVSMFSWTGCFIGGHAGGSWSDKDWSDTPTGALRSSNDPSGFLGGAQVGCDYQFSQFVIGLQGDYSWTDADHDTTDLFAAAHTDRTKLKGLASVTGRLGYAFDRGLFYVRGGGAWERADYVLFDTPTGTVDGTAKETRSGWTAGVGAEYAFLQNWSAFVEYDYYDFGTRNLVFTDGSPITVKETQSVVKGGINWRFNWGGPVVARY